MPLRIVLATNEYDRVRALKDGSVPIAGCAVDHVTAAPAELFDRLFRRHEFDVAEMSFSTYLMALGQDDAFPYVALPVFLSRVFAHGSIYVRTGSGIAEPKDLAGRTVGLPSYHFTRGLVARGLLADEYGVAPRDIVWAIGGVDQPANFDFVPFTPPPGIRAERIGPRETLTALLLAGRIDALISYRDPDLIAAGDARMARLFPDFRAAEQDYTRRTGIFPIMHMLGVRRSLLAEHPWLAPNLIVAFEEAKRRAIARLTDLDALAVTLPWLAAEAHRTIDVMGRDFWPYGVARNRATLAAQARWSFEQGLSPRAMTAADIFAVSGDDPKETAVPT